MQAIDTIRNALRLADAASDTYNVDPKQVTATEKRLYRVDWTAREAQISGSLHRAILDIANAHRSECENSSCLTCDAIRHGMAVSAAALRVERDAEHERLFHGVHP